MTKKLFISTCIPFVLVPIFILLLKISGFLEMGNRLLFSFGMVCYFTGNLVERWLYASNSHEEVKGPSV